MWKKALGVFFGTVATGANFAYGVSKGSKGEPFTPQDIFNPPETSGKVIGRVIHSEHSLRQSRSQAEDELHTLRMKNAAPLFTTNIPHPPVFSDEFEKRIKQGAQDLYKS